MSDVSRRRVDSNLLTTLLNEPDLAPTVRALPAPALRKVIEHVGLEDAGELVAVASIEQLRDVFDEDLWKSATPGGDEAFDARRFVTWLEVLLEAGADAVAEKLAKWDGEFVAFGFSQLVHVLDATTLDEWATAQPAQAERLDAILDTHCNEELDGFILVARDETGWDAVLATLLAIDQRNRRQRDAILEACANATHAHIHSADRLGEVLEADERLFEDAAGERETRRTAQGHVSPADARAFLAHARSEPATTERDPITRAHFREYERAAESTTPAASVVSGEGRPTPLQALLLEAGVDSEPESTPSTEAGTSLFRQALAALFAREPETHRRAVDELVYLANVLIAGASDADGHAWEPAAAAERVFELCDAGLREQLAGRADELDEACHQISEWGVVGLFRIAWAALD